MLQLRYDQQREMLIYAFRYALGRQSYAPHTMMDIILKNKNILSEQDIELIIREIDEAVEDNMAGDPKIDAKRWQATAEELRRTKC